MNRLNLRVVRNRAKARASQNTKAEKNYKKRVTKFLGGSRVFFFFLGASLAFAADSLSIPKHIVEFSRNFEEAKRFVYSRAYRTSDWSGIFDAFPEGIVNMADIGIFDPQNAALDIAVVDGNRIDGTIWWSGSCDLGMPYAGLLIEGRVHIGGSAADVFVFDFFQGQRKEFFDGKFRVDEGIIEFSDFPDRTGLNGTRIAQNPKPASIEGWGELFCEQFTKQFGLH